MAPDTVAQQHQQKFFPISELSSYVNKWTICARVTSKSQLRTFAKGSNTGKVFSIDLLDCDGGEIRATFFNDAVDQHFEKLDKGKCYTFSRGSLKIANKQFNTCTHRYEIVFDRKSEVEEMADNIQIDMLKLHIAAIRSIQSRTLPCSVDLCGILTDAGPVISFTSREGKELIKREITIADDSSTSVQVTLWGERANQDSSVFEGKPLVALKGVLVKEWNGAPAGSMLENGALIFKPTCPEADKVQSWWAQGGSTESITSLSLSTGQGNVRNMNARAMNMAEMRRAADSILDQPELYKVTCRLAIVQMRKQGENQALHYLACQEPKEGSGFPCQRKLDPSGFCALCNRAGKAAPRLNLRCRFADYEDAAWVTTFHEAAQQVLGMKAEEVRDIEAGQDGREHLEASISEKYFNQPLTLTLRAKLDSYQGVSRSNVTCIDARPVSRGEHGRTMLKEIGAMLSERRYQVEAASRGA